MICNILSSNSIFAKIVGHVKYEIVNKLINYYYCTMIFLAKDQDLGLYFWKQNRISLHALLVQVIEHHLFFAIKSQQIYDNLKGFSWKETFSGGLSLFAFVS